MTQNTPTIPSLPPNSVFRRISPEDKALVRTFFAQMNGESRTFFNRNDGNEISAIRYTDGETKNREYFMIEKDGEMIGLVFLYDTHRNIPWLGIAVHEAYKGMGVGRYLIAEMIEYAHKLGRGGILLTTHVANIRGQGLYARMGFERLGMHDCGEVLYLYQCAVS